MSARLKIPICAKLNKGEPLPIARIICKAPNNSGLMVDVNIVRAVCESACWDVVFVNHHNTNNTTSQPANQPNSHPNHGQMANINIFIEHVGCLDWQTKYPTLPITTQKLNKTGQNCSFLLVNQEWLTDWDLMAIRAGVVPLYKTHYAEALFNKYIKIKGFYVGFGQYPPSYDKTADLPKFKDGPAQIPRCQGLAVHFAGSSPLKGTFGLLKAIYGAKGLAKPFILVVTLRDTYGQHRALLDWWAELKPIKSTLPDSFITRFKNPPDDLKTLEFSAVGNIYLYEGLMPAALHDYLQAAAWLAVCPSMAEGFGHYINEARLNQVNVLTLDAPCMNELITDKSQLIPARLSGDIFHTLSHAWTKSLQKVYPVEIWEAADPVAMAQMVIKAASYPMLKRTITICKANQQRAINEALEFAERLKKIINKFDNV